MEMLHFIVKLLPNESWWGNIYFSHCNIHICFRFLGHSEHSQLVLTQLQKTDDCVSLIDGQSVVKGDCYDFDSYQGKLNDASVKGVRTGSEVRCRRAEGCEQAHTLLRQEKPTDVRHCVETSSQMAEVQKHTKSHKMYV